MGKRKEISRTDSSDDMPAWMMNQRSESHVSHKHDSKHEPKKHMHDSKHEHKKKHHHKHHKKHHGKGHQHVGSGSESISSNTSSAPTSPSTSVSTTPRKPEGLASRQELNLLSSPTTPRSPSATAIANPAAGKGDSKGPLDARSLTRSPASAPLSPPFSASIRPLIGPALSPLMRPKRPEGAQQGERKGGEFYKVLAARCAAADVSSPSTCPPPPLRTHIADDPPYYNQWGQRVNGFIGPLGSPGTTPILSFTTPSPGEGKQRKSPRMQESESPCSPCSAASPVSCKPPSHTTEKFACRGVAHEHSPLCIYHQPHNSCPSADPPDLHL